MINALDVIWSFCTFPLWITYLLLVYRPEQVSNFFVSAFLYGKLAKTNKKANLLDHIAIPKGWFSHFYVFASVLFTVWSLVFFFSATQALVQMPRVLTFTLNVIVHNREASVPFAVILWVQTLTTLQVYRRLYECLFISVYSDVKMHIWHYAMGYIFYMGIQYSILSMAFGSKTTASFRLSDLCEAHVVIGTLIFIGAFLLQHDTTKRFANFRKDPKGRVNSLKHEAPRGGMFEYISSPHYFAEIMIYTGLTIVIWNFNFTWFNGLLWTWVNQMAVALLNHRWYQSTFKDYPQRRKAVFPFCL